VPTIPPISSRTERFVRFLRKHAWPIVIGATLLCAASTLLATRLQLKTDLAELLPTADPSVRELRRLQAHLTKLPPNLTAAQVNALEKRLQALGGTKTAMPHAPMPKGTKGMTGIQRTIRRR